MTVTAETIESAGSITPRMAVLRFGVSRSWLFEQFKNRTLPKIQVSPRKVLIPVKSLTELLAAQAQK
jgi:hypothetical protein